MQAVPLAPDRDAPPEAIVRGVGGEKSGMCLLPA